MARNASLLVIFLTVFIDLVGFGIVLPMLSIYSKEYGASGFIAGSIIASYSLMQFLFAPMWGRWSDRIGRRPILLISTAGACVSYIVFAIACVEQSIILLTVSRIAAGICGANLSVASAYIADISPPKMRSERMGLIGMAFGLGFIIGPVLGALSASWFGAAGPGWVAAGICGFNLLLAYFILGESRKPESDPAPLPPRIQQASQIITRPQLGYLFGVFFLATFCFTCFESTFALMFAGTKDDPGNFLYTENLFVKNESKTIAPIDWDVVDGMEVKQGDGLAEYGDASNRKVLVAPASGRVVLPNPISVIPASGYLGSINITKNIAYWLMAFCGIIGAIIQGRCIGVFVKWFGEKWLIVFGLALVGVSLALLPFCTQQRGLIFLMLSLALFAVSSSVYRAPTFGLISINASSEEQGEVMGVTQSIGSLARIIGPIFALSLMDLRLELPYLVCAIIAVVASIIAALRIAPHCDQAVGLANPQKRINLREGNEDCEDDGHLPEGRKISSQNECCESAAFNDGAEKNIEASGASTEGPARINLRAKMPEEHDDSNS
jgi:MFS family permease